LAATHGAEHLVEYIAQPTAGIEIEAAGKPAAARARPAVFKRGMAETVIGGALLLVLQDIVGLADILELRFGRLVARIAVRVVLHGELSVGLLQVVRAGLARNAQGCIEILLGHASALLGTELVHARLQ